MADVRVPGPVLHRKLAIHAGHDLEGGIVIDRAARAGEVENVGQVPGAGGIGPAVEQGVQLGGDRMRCIVRDLHTPAECGRGILQDRLGMRRAEVALEVDLCIVTEVVVRAAEQVVVRERNGHQVIDLILLDQAVRRERPILPVGAAVVTVGAVGIAGGELLAAGEQRAVGVHEERVEA